MYMCIYWMDDAHIIYSLSTIWLFIRFVAAISICSRVVLYGPSKGNCIQSAGHWSIMKLIKKNNLYRLVYKKSHKDECGMGEVFRNIKCRVVVPARREVRAYQTNYEHSENQCGDAYNLQVYAPLKIYTCYIECLAIWSHGMTVFSL